MSKKTLKQLIDEGRFTTREKGVLERLVDRIKPFISFTANFSVKVNVQTEGSLVIGKEYSIAYVEDGDDFSNTGFIEVDVPFIAIAEVPTVWANGTETYNTDITEQVLQNELGEEVVVSQENSDTKLILTVTNGVFAEGKVWIHAPSNTNWERVDENRIEISNFPSNDTLECIKIEVYN